MTNISPLSKNAATERNFHNKRMVIADFDQAPFTIAWEVTRACAFACVHCRADAIPQIDPNELTTEEAFQLVDRLTEFGSPILIFTGGDPMMRKDLFEIIEYATKKGLRCSLTPTATALPTLERLIQAKEAGIRRIALSLDAPTAEVHDNFRQVKGSWQRTMDILHRAEEAGLSVQVNTTVTNFNYTALIPYILLFLLPFGLWLTMNPKKSNKEELPF